jgi:hypothetical protein
LRAWQCNGRQGIPPGQYENRLRRDHATERANQSQRVRPGKHRTFEPNQPPAQRRYFDFPSRALARPKLRQWRLAHVGILKGIEAPAVCHPKMTDVLFIIELHRPPFREAGPRIREILQ